MITTVHANSKYCEMLCFGFKLGFTNNQIRAQAYALSSHLVKMNSVDEFKKLLTNHGIVCTDPMPV